MSEELDRFLSRFQGAKFVPEPTSFWEFIYEGIEKRGIDAALAHPLNMMAIAGIKFKADRVDAETQAQLHQTIWRQRADS